MVAYLIEQGVPLIKWTTLSEEKKVLGQKTSKKYIFFWVFTHYCTKTLRNFTAVLRWCSNLLDGRLFDWTSCATNKMDNFIRRKNKFWAKKLQKNGFFGVFTHYCTKSLLNFTVMLRWCSNLQIVAHFNLKGAKTRIEPQNNSQLFFTISEISRVSRSGFSLREILAHFPLSFSWFNASIALKLKR